MSDNLELNAGEVVERYTIEAAIGKGGVASVYRVRHNTLGSLHAMKVLHLNADEMRKRLVLEGQLQASLRHPNIVAVTDVVDIRGMPGLVMDYIEGPSLRSWLKRNEPELPQAEAIFRGILAGVARAHRHGMVHRDLKPGNVLMATDDDGELLPKVADFGLAKMVSIGGDSDNSLTRTGTTMGTPAYMAPEQVRDSSSVDQRADIFALGCILYELCTGVSPFDHPDVFVVFNSLASGSYRPPETLEPNLPERINNTITGCLAVDPDRRINSCSVLLKVLDGKITEGWATVLPTEEAKLPRTLEVEHSQTSKPRSRSGLLVGGVSLAVGSVGMGAVALAVVVAILVFVGVRWSVPPPDGTQPEVPAAEAPTGEAPPDGAVGSPEAGVPGEGAEVGSPEAGSPEAGSPEAGSPEPQPPVPAPARPEAPVPAPARPEPAAAGPSGTVQATGEADSVWLEGPSGRVELGVVPAGQYRVMASFKGEAPMPAGTVTVDDDQAVTLSCSAAFQVCKAL